MIKSLTCVPISWTLNIFQVYLVEPEDMCTQQEINGLYLLYTDYKTSSLWRKWSILKIVYDMILALNFITSDLQTCTRKVLDPGLLSSK